MIKDDRKTRRPRQREELEFPELGSQHWRNKQELQPVYSARVTPDVKAAFEKWVKAKGITKRQATEFAFQCAMRAEP